MFNKKRIKELEEEIESLKPLEDYIDLGKNHRCSKCGHRHCICEFRNKIN